MDEPPEAPYYRDAPAPARPLWVQVALLGVTSRSIAWLLQWISIALGLAALALGLFVRPGPWLGDPAASDVVWKLSMFVFALLVVPPCCWWYYRAIKWMDCHEQW